jgi:hypothetical protein
MDEPILLLLVDLLQKSGEFPITDEELHDAKETIYERI